MIRVFELDHIVHFVKDPEKAAEQLRALGLVAVSGGKHEMWGTYNCLSYFGLSYIELIGVFDDALLKKSAEVTFSLHDTYKRMGYKEGLTRVALRSDDLERDAERFRVQGFEVDGPVGFSRTRPDGSVVSWKLLYVGNAEQSLDLPFFIQWDEPADKRLADLQAQGAVNAGSLQQVDFAVYDAKKTASDWANILGGAVDEAFEDVERNCIAVPIKLQNIEFVFYCPHGDGYVKNLLAEQGEGPFRVTMNGAGIVGNYKVSEALYELKLNHNSLK